jgi:hypothetical protein
MGRIGTTDEGSLRVQLSADGAGKRPGNGDYLASPDGWDVGAQAAKVTASALEADSQHKGRVTHHLMRL